MKFFILGAAFAMSSVPALAQTAPAAPATPAPATPAPAAPAATSTAKFSLDTPLEAIDADPAAKAVLAKDLGFDVTQHPAYAQFKAMSLTQVAPVSGGLLTPDLLTKIQADLAAIK